MVSSAPPPLPLIAVDTDFVPHDSALFRIHRIAGRYSNAWDELRRVGPLTGMRWDPHPLPPATAASAGVMYAAPDAVTAFGEVFQSSRVIERDPSREFVGWLPTRPLRLLDVSKTFFVQNGGLASIGQGEKSITQEWARAIHRQFGDEIDGLKTSSAVTGRVTFAIFDRTQRVRSFPAAPDVAFSLNSSEAVAVVTEAARVLRYEVR